MAAIPNTRPLLNLGNAEIEQIGSGAGMYEDVIRIKACTQEPKEHLHLKKREDMKESNSIWGKSRKDAGTVGFILTTGRELGG